ncbi:hypothetical protein [uncultured Selenomonas sp.]|uniref:hypothetical protein n=1 Tax=uncultured Selenomonas sp. TaxID=159275 RepID=UPI0025E795F1|nr:hypothetical protein [uncultured Selenomonas sp.]
MPYLKKSVQANADTHAGCLRFHMDIARTILRRLRNDSIDERSDRRDSACRHARSSPAMHLRLLAVDFTEHLLHEMMKFNILLPLRHAEDLLSSMISKI